VVAAAVILNPKKPLPKELNDSKQLSKETREKLAPVIQAKALAWGIGSASVEEIGALNILQATFLAMHRAIAQLAIAPELLLVDGNRFVPYPFTSHHCIIKGDGLFKSIAAASVLAKTHRDALMLQLATEHPSYGWEQNKGYGTLAHREAIALVGKTTHHRPGFRMELGPR
jgi:ribonuclease HII